MVDTVLCRCGNGRLGLHLAGGSRSELCIQVGVDKCHVALPRLQVRGPDRYRDFQPERSAGRGNLPLVKDWTSPRGRGASAVLGAKVVEKPFPHSSCDGAIPELLQRHAGTATSAFVSCARRCTRNRIRLGVALSGIPSALQSEHSLRVHLVAAVVVVIALLVLRPAPVWWALAGLAISAVIAAELVNTLERLVNHLHPDVHAEIRVVGDCAAAAVLVVAVGALCVAAAFAISVLA